MSELDTAQRVWQTRLTALQGDQERVTKQHDAGKMTARERIVKLFDAGSFVEADALQLDACAVSGSGTLDGRLAYCFAQDYTNHGGAMSVAQAQKLLKLLRKAQLTGAPVILLLDSAGAKLQEGALALSAYSRVYAQLARLSGVCPILTAVLGPCRGSAAVFAQLSDIVILVDGASELELHSALVTGEKLTVKALANQGAAHLTVHTEDEALAQLTALVNLLPASNTEDAPLTDGDDLNRVLDAPDTLAADGLAITILDEYTAIQLTPDYGKRLQTWLGKLGGRTVGLIAGDAGEEEGRLDAASCEKAARFVRFCDSYHLPIVTLINSQGLTVGKLSEQAWLMRSLGQLTFAYAEATSPKAAVVVGQAIGAAYVAMGGNRMADVAYAWPGAMISPLTADAAVATLFDEQLNAGESRDSLKQAYEASVDAVYAARQGLVDDVIEPAETRKYLIAALELLSSKHEVALPKKHSNMPL